MMLEDRKILSVQEAPHLQLQVLHVIVIAVPAAGVDHMRLRRDPESQRSIVLLVHGLSLVEGEAQPGQPVEDVSASEEIQRRAHRVEAPEYVNGYVGTCRGQRVSQGRDVLHPDKDRVSDLFLCDTDDVEVREFIDMTEYGWHLKQRLPYGLRLQQDLPYQACAFRQRGVGTGDLFSYRQTLVGPVKANRDAWHDWFPACQLSLVHLESPLPRYMFPVTEV